MSFTSFEPVTQRLHRSELAVPASSPKMIEKAGRCAADVVFLDLEDSVAPDDKARARRNAIAALNDIDWGAKTVSVRVNGLDTHYTYRDVIEIVPVCPRLDMLFIPKIGVAADVYALDVLVTQIELEQGRAKRIGFEAMIETALGLCNVEAIAQSSRRLEAMCFGSGDFAASTAARSTTIGGLNPDYGVLGEPDAGGRRAYFQADPWHAAQARIVAACRAYGLRPLDEKLTCDTKSDLIAHLYLSASQENLCESLGIPAAKVHMSNARWREANRLTDRGLDLTRQRAVGDVLQHMALRRILVARDMLRPPETWRP